MPETDTSMGANSTPPTTRPPGNGVHRRGGVVAISTMRFVRFVLSGSRDTMAGESGSGKGRTPFANEVEERSALLVGEAVEEVRLVAEVPDHALFDVESHLLHRGVAVAG